MAETSNDGGSAMVEPSCDGAGSNAAALSSGSQAAETSEAITSERSTKNETILGSPPTPESPFPPSRPLSPYSDNARGFLLTGIGGVGSRNPGADVGAATPAGYPDAITDELLLMNDVGDAHLQLRCTSVEDPWSGFDCGAPNGNHRGPSPCFFIRGGCLAAHTQLFIKRLFDANPTACVNHVESNCVPPHKQHNTTQRLFGALFATLTAVAITIIFTLQAHGLQLTWMVVYGLFLLLTAVLVVIRMLR